MKSASIIQTLRGWRQKSSTVLGFNQADLLLAAFTILALLIFICVV
jgi:hypothetical protein